MVNFQHVVTSGVSEDSDQPVYLPSLIIIVFAAHMKSFGSIAIHKSYDKNI